ncbi:hypothetical protein sos41_11510 [Alphaproteobacteria bacterium SO-S41]|nr:hypothetical protein sos41_11510 [Alphaproteobacteria bacterium SO-S41]
MFVKTIAIALIVPALSACAVTMQSGADFTSQYAVSYDALADCVYDNEDWGGGPGPRFIRRPAIGETRIEAQGGFDTTTILLFKRAPGGGAIVEIRVASNPERQTARFRATIDRCVSTLPAAAQTPA